MPQPLLVFSSGHPPFSSPFSHTGHTPSWEFLKISKIMNVCVCVLVIHLTDRNRCSLCRFHFTIEQVVVTVCLSKTTSFNLSVFFFFLFAQPYIGETVSHPSPLLWNLVCFCFLHVMLTNTCCLKCKRKIAFVPHITVIVGSR